MNRTTPRLTPRRPWNAGSIDVSSRTVRAGNLTARRDARIESGAACRQLLHCIAHPGSPPNAPGRTPVEVEAIEG